MEVKIREALLGNLSALSQPNTYCIYRRKTSDRKLSQMQNTKPTKFDINKRDLTSH